jgi:hypothetical protein
MKKALILLLVTAFLGMSSCDGGFVDPGPAAVVGLGTGGGLGGWGDWGDWGDDDDPFSGYYPGGYTPGGYTPPAGGGTGPGSESNPIPLTEGVWANGSFTSGGAVWYSFTAAGLTSYYVWWNDSYEGNNSKTADVKVTAYHTDVIPIFSDKDDGWDASQQVWLSGSGSLIKLKVTPYYSSDTGTFAIAYTTTNTRPN